MKKRIMNFVAPLAMLIMMVGTASTMSQMCWTVWGEVETPDHLK